MSYCLIATVFWILSIVFGIVSGILLAVKDSSLEFQLAVVGLFLTPMFAIGGLVYGALALDTWLAAGRGVANSRITEPCIN